MDKMERTALHYAALDDDANAVVALLAEGVSPDAQDKSGFTPLHFAAQEYSVRAASALLDAGATVDVGNAYGNTPLFVAVFNSKSRGEMIKLLRDHAEPIRSGQTPAARPLSGWHD